MYVVILYFIIMYPVQLVKYIMTKKEQLRITNNHYYSIFLLWNTILFLIIPRAKFIQAKFNPRTKFCLANLVLGP